MGNLSVRSPVSFRKTLNWFLWNFISEFLNDTFRSRPSFSRVLASYMYTFIVM